MGECQHHNQCMHYQSGGVTRYETPGWSLFSKRRRYEQTAAQPWPAPAQNAQPARQLGAGEEVHRPFSWRDDIAGPLAFAGVYGGFLTVAAVAVAYAPWPASAVVVVVDGVVCGVFTRLRWDTWKSGDTNPITRKREPEHSAQPSGKWKLESIVQEGNHTTIDGPELADPWAWHRFCKAVVGGREFSQSESKRHKVPKGDWFAVYNPWVARGWLVPKGARKPPVVLVNAKRHIRNYATAPPPTE